MSKLLNGDYDALFFLNDHNRTETHNFIYFENALFVLFYWVEECEKNTSWYKPTIPIMIKKNGRCIARPATYDDYYKYVLKEV